MVAGWTNVRGVEIYVLERKSVQQEKRMLKGENFVVER